MSEYIHQSHNVSKIMYHFVLPAKYRKVVIDEQVDQVIKEVCVEISKRYPISTQIQSYSDSENSKKYNSKRSI